MNKNKYNRIANRYGNAGSLNAIGTGLLSNAGSMASMFPGVGTAVGMGLLAASTIFDALTNINLQAVNLAENSLLGVLKFNFDTSSADALSNQYGTIKATTDYEGTDLGGPLSLVAAAKARELNELGKLANTGINAKFGLATQMVNLNQFLLGLANISANGGGIHIAPSKRGTFTAAASKHNMGVQEFASRVLANKEDYSPVMVKKANFARNAAKWRHDFGGDIALTPDALSYTNLYLNSVEPVENPVYTDRDYFWANVYRDRNNKFYIPGYGGTDYYITEEEAKKRVQDFRKNVDKPTKRDIENFLKEINKNKKSFGGDLNTNGSNFDLGFNYFANGGSHELNPYEGVLIGVDLQGIPNLVEEGEVRVDDYIFSKRLKNPRTNNTFAKDALKANKEAEERPNDVISKNGLKAAMEQLIQEQEEVREENMRHQYRQGGRLFNKFDVGGSLDRDMTDIYLEKVLGLSDSPYYSPIVESEEDKSQTTQEPDTTPRYVHPYSETAGPDAGRELEAKKAVINNSINNVQKQEEPQKLENINTASAKLERTPFTVSTSKKLPKERQMKPLFTFNNNFSSRKSNISSSKHSFKDRDFVLEYIDENVGFKPTKPSLERRSLKKPELSPIKKSSSSYDPNKWNTAARIIGGLAPVLSLAHTLSNPIDYSNAERMEEAVSSIRDVQPRATLAQKARPLIFDPYLEEALAMANYNAALDKATDLSGGNRAAANALALALNYNMQNQIGARARLNQKDIFDAGLQQQGFNRETDAANISNLMRADIANQAADYQRAQLAAQAAAFRESIDKARNASIMDSTNALFNNIGAMGKEGYMMDMIRNNPALLYDWMGNYKSNGGKIKRKGGRYA